MGNYWKSQQFEVSQISWVSLVRCQDGIKTPNLMKYQVIYFLLQKKTLHIWTYKGQFRTIVLIKLLHTSLILNKRIAKLSSISGTAVGDERVTEREDITGDYCKICNQEFYQMKVKSRKNHIRNHMKRSKRTKSPHWGGRWKWKWGWTMMASDPEYWVSSWGEYFSRWHDTK